MASTNNDYQVGKAYRVYYDSDVRKAHVLAILPHPTDPNDRLIAFRYFGRYCQDWHYALIEESDLDSEWRASSLRSILQKRARSKSKDTD